jgi:hypothetical protein
VLAVLAVESSRKLELPSDSETASV